MAASLDHFLPDYHFREVHALGVRAPAHRVFQAIKEVTAAEMPLVRVLFALRALPALIARKGRAPLTGSQPLLQQMLAGGFVQLSEIPGHELVLGAVGQFWRPLGQPYKLAHPQEFLLFDRPGYAKAVTSFSITEGGGPTGVTVRTETRVYVPDAGARRRFALYWLLIRPGSGLMRRAMLRAIRRRAEQMTP